MEILLAMGGVGNSLNRLFVISSVLLLLITIFWIVKDIEPEWKEYQRRYKEIILSKAKSEREKKDIMREKYEIKQIIVKKLNRIDRCITCHLGFENPDMMNEEEPFRYHPGILRKHPVEKFGCTVCHLGQGMATTVKDAHGKGLKHWHEPLLYGEYIQSSCGKCHFETYLKEAPLLSIGRRLYDFYGCRNCHKVYMEGGVSGPSLNAVASKLPDEFVWGNYKGERSLNKWLILHFKNPQIFQPDSKMTNFGIPDENAKALTIYMLSLTGEKFPKEYYRGKKPYVE